VRRANSGSLVSRSLHLYQVAEEVVPAVAVAGMPGNPAAEPHT
jgi:hypothetical protein